MTLRKSPAVAAFVWIIAITGAHVVMNLPKLFEKEPKMKIGFLPVTCHLTCSWASAVAVRRQGNLSLR